MNAVFGAILLYVSLAVTLYAAIASLRGTKLVWLVYPEQRIVEVYALEVDLKILTERDTLEGGDVLAGFMLAVSEIFKAI